MIIRDSWWYSWLTQCATSWKVACSFPAGVTGIFHCLNPSGRTMHPGSIQPLREMSTRGNSWSVKAATLPPSCAVCLEIWEPQPSGILRACSGLYTDRITLPALRNTLAN